jgi:dienelactone hydrolase
MGPVSMVVIPVKFATRNIAIQMSVNASGQVSVPLLRQAEAAWQPPAYVKPDSFHERELSFGTQWKLPATLTVPNGKGPFPAVVLVHGIGPNDRDETIGGTKVFKDLAQGLASRGIAALRYEKRTKVYASKMAGTSYTAYEEVVEDAALAAALVRQQPEVDTNRVYVAGHSIGGYLAPRLDEDAGKLAGLILLNANARPLEEIILEQAATLPALQAAGMKAEVAKLKSLEAADADVPPILNMPAAYWFDLKGYDAPAAAKKMGIPVLILQGERDLQASMKDFAAWKQGLSGAKVTAQSFPSLNHLFVAGEGKATEAEYKKAGHVAPEIIDAIVKFVNP